MRRSEFVQAFVISSMTGFASGKAGTLDVTQMIDDAEFVFDAIQKIEEREAAENTKVDPKKRKVSTDQSD